jgi:serine/threonine protein kinase
LVLSIDYFYSKISHPNIIQFIGAITKHPMGIIMELMDCSLNKAIHDPNQTFSFNRIIEVSQQISSGMQYLISRKPSIHHRDLKSCNILLNLNSWKIKITDFGLSTMKDYTNCTITEKHGTPQWSSPEGILFDFLSKHSVALYGNTIDWEKADIYSFGVVLWEMVTREIPWKGSPLTYVLQAVYNENKRLHIPETTLPEISMLITACWEKDPSQRPTFVSLNDQLTNLSSKDQKGKRSVQDEPNQSISQDEYLEPIKEKISEPKLKSQKLQHNLKDEREVISIDLVQNSISLDELTKVSSAAIVILNSIL